MKCPKGHERIALIAALVPVSLFLACTSSSGAGSNGPLSVGETPAAPAASMGNLNLPPTDLSAVFLTH